MKDERLTKQISRILDLLDSLDPSKEGYIYALDALDKLRWISTTEDVPHIEPRHIEDMPKEVIVTPVVEEVTEVEPTPMAEPVQEAVVEEAYTYDKVRDICTKAMSRGVSIKPIIEKYVNGGDAAKLTNVACEDYAALVAEVENAK